jgi:hypothetical protein
MRFAVIIALVLVLWDSLAVAQTRPAPASNQIELNSASRLCCSVSAFTRSAIASASVSPSLPCSKARRVNSPGSARRQKPSRWIAASAAFTTARPPWRCSSAMVSPVSVLGASNQTTRPRSTLSPLIGSNTLRTAMCRGAGRAGSRAERPRSKAPRSVRKIRASLARGPLSRMTQSAPG